MTEDKYPVPWDSISRGSLHTPPDGRLLGESCYLLYSYILLLHFNIAFLKKNKNFAFLKKKEKKFWVFSGEGSFSELVTSFATQWSYSELVTSLDIQRSCQYSYPSLSLY